MGTAFKWSTLLKIGVPYLIFFFAPIGWALVGIGVLVFADVITGVRAAKKRGEKIHSRVMGRTISKMIFYTIAILLARVMELVFIPWLPMAQLTSGYIALVEFKSNMENIGTITNTDIWNHLKEKIEQVFTRSGGAN